MTDQEIAARLRGAKDALNEAIQAARDAGLSITFSVSYRGEPATMAVANLRIVIPGSQRDGIKDVVL